MFGSLGLMLSGLPKPTEHLSSTCRLIPAPVHPAVSARGCRLLPTCRLIPCSFFRVSKFMVVDSEDQNGVPKKGAWHEPTGRFSKVSWMALHQRFCGWHLWELAVESIQPHYRRLQQVGIWT